MGKLVKRGTIWHAQWVDAFGEFHRKSTGSSNRETASVYLAARELDRVKQQSGIAVSADVRFIDAFAEFLAASAPEWSDGWKRAIKSLLPRFVLGYWGERQLATVTKPQALEWLQWVAQQKKLVPIRGGQPKLTEEPVTGATVNRVASIMSRFGNWCLDRQLLAVNPWARLPKKREQRRAPPTLDVEAWLAALPERWRWPLTFAVDTGWRTSELKTLRWKNVDLARGLASVPTSKNGEPKVATLSMRLVAHLINRPHRPDGLVFGSGDPRKAMRRVAREQGLAHLWPHALRHIWATNFGRAGATTADLQAGGGWKTAELAARYSHATLTRQAELTKKMRADVAE